MGISREDVLLLSGRKLATGVHRRQGVYFILFIFEERSQYFSLYEKKRKRIHMRVNDVIRIRKVSNDASKQANDRQDSTSGATVTFAQLHPLPECDG